MTCAFSVTVEDLQPVTPFDPFDPLVDVLLPALPEMEDDLGELGELDALQPLLPPQAIEAPAADAAAPAAEVAGQAPGIVAGILTTTGSLAAIAQENALSAVDALAGFTSSVTPLYAPTIPIASVTFSELGTAPVAADLTPSFPAAPDEPVVGTAPLIDIGEPPAYDVVPADLLAIALPDPFTALVPSEPVMDAIPVPVEPDFVLPQVPTMLALNLPDVPVISIPLFDEDAATAPALADVAFAYADVEYNSALLAAMNARMADLAMNADSGIAQDIEDALFDRARDREALLTHRATAEALRLMRARGFRMPEGSLVRIIQQALQTGLNRESALERDISIEIAQLEQLNFKFALDMAVQLEARMIEKSNAVQARALEAAKASVQTQIRLFNARVLLFSADVQAFSMMAGVFRTRLEAALAHISVYRAQLDGQRLVGQINTQQVAVYQSQIDGVLALVDVYKSRVAAAKEQIESEKGVVENYKAQTMAFDAQVDAKKTEYDAFATSVRGEVIKAEQFGTQIAAYRSRVDAFDALARAKLGAQTLQFKQEGEFPLELYRSKIAAYQTGVAASTEQMRANAALFEARVRAFSVTEGAGANHVNTQLEVVRANTLGLVEQAKLEIDAGRANLDMAIGTAATAQNNARTVGQLVGQMTAAAIAAQGVNASISESGSLSSSNSESNSSSNSTSDSSVVSQNASTSESTAYSNVVSNSQSLSSNESTGVSNSTNVSASLSNSESNTNSEAYSTGNSSSKTRTYSSTISTNQGCVDSTIHSD